MELDGDDYRLEAMLAFWIENQDGNLDQVTIHPLGTFKRPYDTDVYKVRKNENQYKIEITREGLYDMLPEGLFHEGRRKVLKETQESVQESIRYRKEEKAARKFFLPLEQEFYRQRVWLERLELKAYMTSISSQNVSKFLRFWGIDPTLFSIDQGHFMLAMFPNLHKIAGNLELSAYCLEILMSESVVVQVSPSPETLLEGDDSLVSILDESVLGVDSVMGDRFIDDEPGLDVQIGPIEVEKVFDFLEGGISFRQLKVLYGFFFPAETIVETNISVKDGHSGFALLPEEPSFSRLDYTTVL